MLNGVSPVFLGVALCYIFIGVNEKSIQPAYCQRLAVHHLFCHCTYNRLGHRCRQSKEFS